MKVAHGINLHDIDESWQQQNVGYKSDCILRDVLQEINGSQDHGQEVDTEHNTTTQCKERKVSLSSWFKLLFLFVPYFLWRVKASFHQEDGDSH
jgi:hypothetical protein